MSAGREVTDGCRAMLDATPTTIAPPGAASLVAFPHLQTALGRPRSRRRRRPSVALILASIAIAVSCGAPGHATGESDHPERRSEEKRSRGTWAALLAGTIVLGALATGGAYLMRDNLVGRSVAVSAAAWGGFGLGAGVGSGAVQLYGCRSADCSMEEAVAIGVGSLLGATAASIAGSFLTANPGMSRPYVAAAGFAPALVFFTVGTVTDW